MADDKKNIPDAGKVDNPPELGKVEQAAPPVQDQPAPAKAEAPVVEDASPVVTPPAAEQPAPAGKEAPKDKDAPAPSKGDTPPGKGEKQTTIPGMEDPAPTGKVVDFTAARDGAMKGKPPEKAVAPDKGKQADKAKDAAKPRRGRPARADKAAPDKAKPQPRDKMSQSKPPAGKGAPATAEAPAATEQPPAPRDATRGVKDISILPSCIRSKITPLVSGTMRKCRDWWSQSRPPGSISLHWCGPVRAADMRSSPDTAASGPANLLGLSICPVSSAT